MLSIRNARAAYMPVARVDRTRVTAISGMRYADLAGTFTPQGAAAGRAASR